MTEGTENRTEPRNAKYIQNGFSVIFPRQKNIHRKAYTFADSLSGSYSEPEIYALPEDFEPQAPRIIFNSTHLYSQIAISQVSITLNVNYSPDWQADIELGRAYLLERAPIIFDLVRKVKQGKTVIRPSFCGLVTLVHVPGSRGEQSVLQYLRDRVGVDASAGELYDLQQKITTIIEGKYFNNITIENYRSWNIEGVTQSTIRLSRKTVSEQGIQITGDYNDRYAFQEKNSYRTNKREAGVIINHAIDSVIVEVQQSLRGVQNEQ